MIVFLSIKSFFLSNKLLAAAFSVLMIVCLTGGLFGINYAYCNVDFYNEYVSSLKNYTVVNSHSELKEPLREYLRKYAEQTAYAYTTFTASVEEEQVEIEAFIYVSEEYYELMTAAYGVTFTKEDIDNGAAKIMLSSKSYDTSRLGKGITLSDAEYEVIGLTATQNIIPFFSLTDTATIDKITIVLSSPLKTSAEKEAFTNELSSIFWGMRISAPESDDSKSLVDYAPMLIPTVVLIILGFINLSFLYVYFIKMREKHYSVFRTVGASVFRILLIFLAEILLLYSAAYLISLAAFKVIMVSFFSAQLSLGTVSTVGVVIADSMTLLRCFGCYLVLAAVFILSFLPSVGRTLRRDISGGR